MTVAPAAANPRRVAARVGATDFQVRQPLKHATEDQARLSNSGFQRISDQVTQRVSLQPIGRCHFMRVDEDQHVEFLGALKKRKELRLVEVLSVHAGGNQHGRHAMLLHETIQLPDRLAHVLQRQDAHAHHASGKSHSVFGDSVINDLANPHCYGSGSPERKQRRQQRFNDHVDLLRGHLTQAPLRVDQARAQSRRAADILYDGFAALVIFLDATTHTLGIAPDRFNILGGAVWLWMSILI